MREQIDELIKAEQTQQLISLLEKAQASDVRYAIKQIAYAFQGSEPPTDQAAKWMSRPEPISRHVACGLLVQGYESDPQVAVRLLLPLADDDDLAVRESAGTACGKLLQKDFSSILPVLREWCQHPSENVRRAVLIAVMEAAKTRRAGWAEPMLRLIEPLLSDRHTYVRRNLGPFALGSGLLLYYPNTTFDYLIHWSTSNDEQVLWNVAMAFAASAGPSIVKKALIILRKLSLDERRYVWRATASAMWKLGRKKPEIIRPELLRWLEDERRVHVAREALKYL